MQHPPLDISIYVGAIVIDNARAHYRVCKRIRELDRLDRVARGVVVYNEPGEFVMGWWLARSLTLCTVRRFLLYRCSRQLIAAV